MYSAAFVLLVLASSQVLADSSSTSAEYPEMMDVLISVNNTVNKMYELMSSQRDRDMELIESKIKENFLQIRAKREAPETGEGLDKIQDALKTFQNGFSSFMKNFTSSDLYKQAQEIGNTLQEKGKELGAKLEETIKSARDDSEKKP